MPKLIRLYITQVLVGFAIAAVFVAALLWFNVANLWSLVSGSDVGVLAVVILWVMNGIVFAGVQFGWKIMSMAETDQDPRGGLPVVERLVPVAATQNPPRASRRG